jgi:hypothetical protein
MRIIKLRLEANRALFKQSDPKCLLMRVLTEDI